MRQRITTLSATEFKADKAGNLIVPDGWELYKIPTREERIQAEIKRLEKELEGMKEPTKEELVEDSKINHPFYAYRDEVEMLKEQLKKLK